MRSRLHSVILLPMLFAVFGLDDSSPTATSTTGGAIRLEFPAGRRVPAASAGAVPMTTVPVEAGVAAAFEGCILDGRTREPIAGAEVSIPELDRRTVTDGAGRFAIGNVPARPTSYEVLVTCPGYQSFFADTVFEPGKRVNCEYRLKPVGW